MLGQSVLLTGQEGQVRLWRCANCPEVSDDVSWTCACQVPTQTLEILWTTFNQYAGPTEAAMQRKRVGEGDAVKRSNLNIDPSCLFAPPEELNYQIFLTKLGFAQEATPGEVPEANSLAVSDTD